MIEKTILDYMNDRLSVPCFMEMPTEQPKSFVLIEKTGSSKTNHIETATMVFQAYSDTLEHSAMLNEEVKKVVEKSIELDAISDAFLNSDYYFPDTTKRKYRYQSVFGLVFHFMEV